MWSSAHAAVGGALMIAIPDPVVGGLLAFGSHFVLDYIGETGYNSDKEALAIETSMIVVYAMAAMTTDIPWLLAWAWIASNLPDLIDKPMKIFFGKESWFSCHNGKGLLSINNWKFGYPVVFRLTKTQTILSNILLTFLFLLICLS